jgi:hypothetical protein
MASGVGFVENATHVGAAAANTTRAAIQRKSMVDFRYCLRLCVEFMV